MNALGIIFSNLNNEMLDELTRKRTTASIPFGGRYRLIDFALSNLVSADIINVGVVALKNYQSLMDHLGSGKDWDLSRKNGGLRIFPPFGNYKSDFVSSSRLDGLKSIIGYLTKAQEELVVLTDSDSVNTIDVQAAMEEHVKNGADITVLYKNMIVENDLVNHMNLLVDKDKRVIKASLVSISGSVSNVGINMWIVNRRLLINLIEEANASNLKGFEQDIILANVNSLKIYGYEYLGQYLHVNSMENYFKNNMLLLNENVRKSIFEADNHRIYTKVRDSAPTRYGSECSIENSFIADGCEIEGKVINSILFRGVKIGKGTVIKNSILMQDTIVGNNVSLESVITDKNVTVRDKNNLAGCEKIPYYLGKNVMI